MTLTTNARLAGTAYLAYLVFGIGGMAIGTAGASAVSGVMNSQTIHTEKSLWPLMVT